MYIPAYLSAARLDLAGSHRGTLYGSGLYMAECSSKAPVEREFYDCCIVDYYIIIVITTTTTTTSTSTTIIIIDVF